MIEIVEYNDKHEAAWAEYVERSPDATVAHSIGWRQVIRDGLGHRPIYLMALRNGRVTGILPLFRVQTWWRSRYLISLPWIDYGGVCADDPESAELLVSKACLLSDDYKVEFMELRSTEGKVAELAARTDKVTFLLKLQPDAEVLWKSFNAKLRNLIRKSRKFELTTQFGGVELLREFYKIFSHNMRDLGTPVWGIGFFKGILTTFQDQARIVLVKKQDQSIAGALVLYFKDRVYIPSASAYRSSLRYAPNYCLYWSCIEKGCREGYQYFDFGRSSWHSNTFKFKKQWVAEPTQLTWQYYLCRTKEVPAINPDNPKYRLMIGLWRRLPVAIANILGPRVIRNFP